MRKKNSEIQYTEKDYMDVLLNQYALVAVIDANDNSFRVIKIKKEIKPLVNCFKKMVPLMIAFCQAHIDAEWRERFREFADIPRIAKAFLDGKKIEEGIFVNNKGDWIKIKVFPVPGYSKDNMKGIMAFENLTASAKGTELSHSYVNGYSLILRVDSDKEHYHVLSSDSNLTNMPEAGSMKEFYDNFYSHLAVSNKGSFDNLYDLAEHPENGFLEEEFIVIDETGNSHFYAAYGAKVIDSSGVYYTLFFRNSDEVIAKRVNEKRESEERMINLIEEQNEALKVALDTAEAASKAKSVFLSNMSHDIRTPMNAITGMTNIAKKNINDPEKVKDCLDKITVASNHLLSLINNILDMSKIENGISTLNEDHFCFSEMMEDIRDIVQPQIKSKNLKMRMSTKGIVHDRIIGDTLRLRQAFINIIGNSIKFTPEGGTISVRIKELRETHVGYATFCCSFADNGIGMNPEFIDKIFEPFEREKNMTMSKIEGTGLGMAITKNIIEMMNGHIKVKSEVGKGTTFKIILHLKMQEEQVWQNAQADNFELADFANVDYSKKRMLLVEDNELNMEIAEDIIGMTGIQIEKAWDGTEAVEKVANSPEHYYDIVLCDIQMPYMNGYVATSKIREMEREDVKTLPIVAMTANAFAEDRQKALDVGMNDHIVKPIDIQNLFEILHRFLHD